MPKYRLLDNGRKHYGPGGVLLAPGSIVEMSEQRFTDANLKDRFERVSDGTKAVEIPAAPPLEIDSSPDAVEVATVDPDLPGPEAAKPVDWDKLAADSATYVIQRVSEMTEPNDLRALNLAERRARARASVIKAINKRLSDLED